MQFECRYLYYPLLFMHQSPFHTQQPNHNFISDVPFIFLAEDDVDDQELLIDALSAYNDQVKVQTACNGKKAITYLENLPDSALPCLIVLDYNLPEMNGGEILQSLSNDERYQAIPKVVWSTSNSPLYRQLSLELGALAYFVKPSDTVGIKNVAKEMLGFCEISKN